MTYKKRLIRKGCLFQVYEMVGNSTVEVLEKGKGNLSFPFVKVPEGLTGAFCGCEKVKKMLWFCDLFIYKDSSLILQQLKEMQSSKLGMLTHSLLEILPKNAF